MKRNHVVVLLIAAAILAMDVAILAQAVAQPSAAEQEIQLLRKDVQSQRKQLIAANMTLTDDEAVKFWPVFDQLTAELKKINDTRLGIVTEYAENFDALNEAQAAGLIKRTIEADVAMAQLRLKYVPLIQKVLPAKKAAMFFQMDRRLGLLIELQLTTQIPLVTP